MIHVEYVADHAFVFLSVNGAGAVRHAPAGFEQLDGTGNELALVQADGFELGDCGLDNRQFGSETERTAGRIQQDVVKGFGIKASNIEQPILGRWLGRGENLNSDM